MSKISKKEVAIAASAIIASAKTDAEFFKFFLNLGKEVEKWNRCYNALGEEKATVSEIRDLTRSIAEKVVKSQVRFNVPMVSNYYEKKQYLKMKDCLNIVDFIDLEIRSLKFAQANKLSLKEAVYELCATV